MCVQPRRIARQVVPGPDRLEDAGRGIQVEEGGHMFAKTVTVIASIAVAVLVSACAQRQVSYKKEVQPILQRSCGTCHDQGGVGYKVSGFSVGSYAALMKGTKYGAMINPGHSKQSNLVWLLEHDAHPSINMPKLCEQMNVPAGKCTAATPFARQLPKHEVALIARWIDQGARDN